MYRVYSLPTKIGLVAETQVPTMLFFEGRLRLAPALLLSVGRRPLMSPKSWPAYRKRSCVYAQSVKTLNEYGPNVVLFHS